MYLNVVAYVNYPIILTILYSHSLFQLKFLAILQCAAGDDEPMVALVVGGRHPGHYFLDSDDFNDVVTR